MNKLVVVYCEEYLGWPRVFSSSPTPWVSEYGVKSGTDLKPILAYGYYTA